ncbi:hypothetical protein HDV00_012119 [Rhizophlyctis rosea]|nr:hypothetical protein HDV00_012119 [Rhizophlyctis rosea]
MDTKSTFELEYSSTAEVLPLHKDDLQPPPKYTPSIPSPSSSQLRIIGCIFLATILGFIAGMALPRPVFDATAWSISPFLRDVRITGVAPFLPDGHPLVVVVTNGEGEGDHVPGVGEAMDSEDTVAVELHQACKGLANELEVGVMSVDDVGGLEEVLKEEAGEGLPPFEHVQKNVRIGVVH